MYSQWIHKLVNAEGGLDAFTKGYEKMGMHEDPKTHEFVYREWAPGVKEAFLVGEFSIFFLTAL